MAGTINKVILVGNLGREPEVRQTSNGQRLCNFPLATSDVWNDRQTGERRERTEWHRIVLFDDRLVDLAERYLHKGSKVYVEGKLQTRKWQGQDGQDRYTTEVVLQRYQGVLTMLDSRGGSSGEGSGGASSSRGAPQRERVGAMDTAEPAPGPGGGDDLDDDIPF